MSVISIIGIILQIIIRLPSLIVLGGKIIGLIRKFKDGGWDNDVAVIGEILQLILDYIGINKTEAKLSFKELHSRMSVQQVSGDHMEQYTELRDRLKKCTGVACPSDLVSDDLRDKYRV